MGGHRGSSSKVVLGAGVNVSRTKRDLRKRMVDASATSVATTAMEAIVVNPDPTVTALYAAYKFAKFFYPIAETGVDEYTKTGDAGTATNKMIEKAGEQVIKKAKEKGVEAVVNAAWASAKRSSKIETDTNIDTAVTTAVTETMRVLIKNEQT